MATNTSPRCQVESVRRDVILQSDVCNACIKMRSIEPKRNPARCAHSSRLPMWTPNFRLHDAHVIAPKRRLRLALDGVRTKFRCDRDRAKIALCTERLSQEPAPCCIVEPMRYALRVPLAKSLWLDLASCQLAGLKSKALCQETQGQGKRHVLRLFHGWATDSHQGVATQGDYIMSCLSVPPLQMLCKSWLGVHRKCCYPFNRFNRRCLARAVTACHGPAH